MVGAWVEMIENLTQRSLFVNVFNGQRAFFSDILVATLKIELYIYI